MSSDWFFDLTGFRESSYADTRNNLEVAGTTLRSKVNGRSWSIGELETATLREIRSRASGVTAVLAGPLKVSSIVADVSRLHRDPANRSALFQVASQFNLLEMTGPSVTPESGVTRYAMDRTQGPACAIAAGAATIYRNYFAMVGDQIGQTAARQIDCLADIGAALGNDRDRLWTMMNGYALCTEDGLTQIDGQLDAMGESGRDTLRDCLRIGLHWNVDVTSGPSNDDRVSQAFCSALPVSYAPVAAERWTSFATLILEGAYEATMWAAVLNAGRFRSPVVYLTMLGGGAFGNEQAWILVAMRRALNRMRDVALDVRIVSFSAPGPGIGQLVAEYHPSSVK